VLFGLCTCSVVILLDNCGNELVSQPVLPDNCSRQYCRFVIFQYYITTHPLIIRSLGPQVVTLSCEVFESNLMGVLSRACVLNVWLSSFTFIEELI
jgi:hypothetical protein